MRVMLGKAGLYEMTKGTVSVCRLGLVLRASSAGNVRSPLYLGFKKI